MLRIGIVGAGAIGCYVAGSLAAHARVTLIGRDHQREMIERAGLTIIPIKGKQTLAPPESFAFSDSLGDLANSAVVLVAVKSGQTSEVGVELATRLDADALVVSLQNGVSNAETLRQHLPRVLASIVTFNVVSGDDGHTRQTTSGPLVIESPAEAPMEAPIFELLDALKAGGLEPKARSDFKRHQWTKLIINLNNAITALSGESVSGLLESTSYRRLIAAVTREALDVLAAAKIAPASMRGIPLSWMVTVLKLPTPVVKLVMRSRMKIDRRARSSMWIDLEKRRRTEVDHLNGEVVRLAEANGTEAPLNAALVRLVHEAEDRGDGPPNLSADTLAEQLRLR